MAALDPQSVLPPELAAQHKSLQDAMGEFARLRLCGYWKDAERYHQGTLTEQFEALHARACPCGKRTGPVIEYMQLLISQGRWRRLLDHMDQVINRDLCRSLTMYGKDMFAHFRQVALAHTKLLWLEAFTSAREWLKLVRPGDTIVNLTIVQRLHLTLALHLAVSFDATQWNERKNKAVGDEEVGREHERLVNDIRNLPCLRMPREQSVLDSFRLTDGPAGFEAVHFRFHLLTTTMENKWLRTAWALQLLADRSEETSIFDCSVNVLCFLELLDIFGCAIVKHLPRCREDEQDGILRAIQFIDETTMPRFFQTLRDHELESVPETVTVLKWWYLIMILADTDEPLLSFWTAPNRRRAIDATRAFCNDQYERRAFVYAWRGIDLWCKLTIVTSPSGTKTADLDEISRIRALAGLVAKDSGDCWQLQMLPEELEMASETDQMEATST